MTTEKEQETADTTGGQGERSLIFTPAGTFKVEGSVHEALRRLAAEEWPMFTLADGGEQLVVRSSEVAAVQHLRTLKGTLGFRP